VKLLDSLLDAIVRLEGDALVMHVGEKPYVITASASMNAYRGPLAWGQVELSSRVLTFDAVSTMLSQILPADQQRALDELGAIEHEILPPDGVLDRFTVVAARGGEDVWVEVRRKALPPAVSDSPAPAAAEAVQTEIAADTAPEAVPEAEPFQTSALESGAPPQPIELASEPAGQPSDQPVDEPGQARTPEWIDSIVMALPGEGSEEVPLNTVPDHAIQLVDDEPQDAPTEEEVDAMLAATATALLTSGLTDEQQVHEVHGVHEAHVPDTPEPAFELAPPAESVAEQPEAEAEAAAPAFDAPPGTPLFSDEAVRAAAPEAIEIEEEDTDFVVSDVPDVPDAGVGAIEITQEPMEMTPLNAGFEPAASATMPPAAEPIPAEMRMEATPETGHAEPADSMSPPSSPGSTLPVQPAEYPAGDRIRTSAEDEQDEGRSGTVVPIGRTVLKPEIISTPFTPAPDAALMQTLRAAAARGAATVYVVAQSKPMIRVDGEIVPLESEPILTAADVDRLVLELAPPRRRDALQSGPVEWLCDVPEIGRIRCLTFKDHRGPGVLFRMFPPRAISADQLGLTPEVQALCQQSDGLVLVTGARASGKSTLLNAFVDLINRTRSDHVITVESQIGFVHESRRSFISQRETRGDADLAASVARAALREDPDVMMIEDLKSPDLVSAALEGAESGRLVLASVPAASTIGALERLIEVFPADRRAKVRASLATALRGVMAQVLLRRVTGGRVAAREILLNTPGVSALVLEGKMFQLPVVLDSGRRHGMVPLTDSLAGFVRDGTVHAGEAYRKALDRAALVAVLKREGVDTSFAERMA